MAMETLQDEIEELSFDNNAEPPRKRRIWLCVLAVIAVIALVLGSSAAWYMWQHHLRRVPVSINGVNRLIRVDTSIATLLADNGDFQAKPGRLLDITGKVIDKTGGRPIAVAINGSTVQPGKYESQFIVEGATITVESGADMTESHRVTTETVPYDTDINLNNGPLQEMKSPGKDGQREVWIGEKSGKKVEKRIKIQPQTLVVTSRSVRPEGRKIIALTFDDGPSQYSDAILDILKSKEVKATFFDVGTSSARYADTEKRMLTEGHQVASHSNTHAYLPKLNRDELRSELKAGFDSLKNASGVDTRVMRSPYGAFGVEQWKQAYDLVDMNVIWDIDTEDWKTPGAQAIHDAVLNNAHNGAVVLMHDGGGGRSQDVEALPGIIDDLKKQGYEFVTIEQMAKMQM